MTNPTDHTIAVSSELLKIAVAVCKDLALATMQDTLEEISVCFGYQSSEYKTFLTGITHVENLIADLNTAIETGGWRPIKTAPKDGQEIVVAYARQGFVKKLVCWNKLWKHWQCKGDVDLGLENNATHWMPLPPPPNSPSKELT